MNVSPIHRCSKRCLSGFTLVELMVSVSIIAILIAIGIASYATVNKRSNDTKRKSDVEQIRAALEMYRAENGYYPSLGTGSWADVSGLAGVLVSTYMPAIPADPQNSAPYTYQYKATDIASGNYYGYCLSATLEIQDPEDTCTPDTNQNYGLKNP